MPLTHFIDVEIDGATVEIGQPEDLGLRYSYALEDPENFEQKQGGISLNVLLPATPTNDRIFNSFHNPNVIDLTGQMGVLTGISITTPGHAWTVGDTFTIDSGGGPHPLAIGRVDSISGGGGVTSCHIIYGGYGGYVVGSLTFTNAVSGTGTSLTVTITDVIDIEPVYTGWRTCRIVVNGVELLTGSAILENASHTRLPGQYSINCYNQNSNWVIQAKDLTLWDCLSDTPHTFDVATVEYSWDHFDDDEDHDYVYCPVRYRQSFGDNDDAVNIYHLRPSLSIYWMLIRGFRILGVNVNSSFLNTTNYFRKMVMPFVFGDFYDLNSEMIKGLSFIAAGILPDLPGSAPGGPPIYTGNPFVTGLPQSSWGGDPASSGAAIGGTMYVMSGTPTAQDVFDMSNTLPPNGQDNFGLYSFDVTTGTLKFTYSPPPQIFQYTGNNININFVLSVYLGMQIVGSTGHPACTLDCQLEVKKNGVLVSSNSILPTGAPISSSSSTVATYPSSTERYFPISPTVYNCVVTNVNIGDVLTFRLKFVQTGINTGAVKLCQAGYINVNPGVTGANTWQYNPITEKWANIDSNISDSIWQPVFSTLKMDSLQLAVGGNVHFKEYDKFRSYKFLDLIRGLVDLFDLSIQTDPITNTVTIEPTNDYALPDGTQMNGYFKKQRKDWTAKQDLSKDSVMSLFSDTARQMDFSMRGDGSDGGLNIFSARYKGIYLNNKIINRVNNTNPENGIVSAIPGASRYMFPSRFQLGSQQQVNRFFSPVMHYKHQPWKNLGLLLGFSPADCIAPQLICIIPENVNDSSASAVTQTFEPKIAYYAGKQAINAVGTFRWQGDPFGRGYDANGVGIPTYNHASDQIAGQPLSMPSSIGWELPYMFAVDYTGWVGTAPGTMAPILTYSDQLINGVVKPGLMKTYFLKRLAIMKYGRLYKPWMHLDLGDITDWEHQNNIIIDGALYHLVGIDNFNPITDESCQCTLWKVANPDQSDLVNCYPSSTSLLTNPTTLTQFDLKYAPLMLFYSDIPIT